ncbi:hypothetical protein BDZ89DRAFT_369127 [Hymenopellis radicata]|nr:hypothetical protein BDZ89DRAFT_369127 [Hymenopellis radicata]
MASISSDDSFHCHVSKPNRHLSLALRDHGTSSSSFSAGPLTPHDDSLLEDEDFFSLPSLKKPDGAVPPHLFSHHRTLSTVPDNPNLSSLAETSIAFPSSISSFEIIGTLGRGTYGKVLLGSHARAPGLQAIKVLQKTGMHRYGIEEVERELRTLRSFSDTSADPRTAFLQNMLGTFSDERFVFIVLVREPFLGARYSSSISLQEYHPTPLSDSDLSSRLRLDGPVGLPTSKSLPHTFPLRQLHNMRIPHYTRYAFYRQNL